MKARHVVSLSLLAVALALLCIGMAPAAGVLAVAATLVELFADAITGKQTNR